MTAREFQFNFDHGEPPSIRCDQCELVVLETKKDAVQHVTGLVGRYGVGSFPQTISQIFLPNSHDFRLLKLGQRRELFLGQSENFEKALPAPDRRRVLSIDIELDFAGGQLTNDIEKPAGRECGCTGLVHLGLATAAYADIEIGRG